MATITGTFTVRPPNVFVIDIAGHAASGEHTIDKALNNHPSPVVRAVVDEYRANGTLSGSITITAV